METMQELKMNSWNHIKTNTMIIFRISLNFQNLTFVYLVERRIPTEFSLRNKCSSPDTMKMVRKVFINQIMTQKWI